MLIWGVESIWEVRMLIWGVDKHLGGLNLVMQGWRASGRFRC